MLTKAKPDLVVTYPVVFVEKLWINKFIHHLAFVKLYRDLFYIVYTIFLPIYWIDRMMNDLLNFYIKSNDLYVLIVKSDVCWL